MSAFSDVIKSFEPVVAQEAYNLLEQYKAEGLAVAQAGGLTAVNAVVAAVSKDLPSGGIYLFIKPALEKAIQSAAPSIVAQLGTEEQALIALAEHELISLGAKA